MTRAGQMAWGIGIDTNSRFIIGCSPTGQIITTPLFTLATDGTLYVTGNITAPNFIGHLSGTADIATRANVWSSTITYAVNDFVFRSGKLYVALQTSTNVDPSTDGGTYWAENKGGIESGSNANGYFIKYTVGTMEQWTIKAETLSINSGPADSEYYTDLKWTFPQAFVDKNYAVSGDVRIFLHIGGFNLQTETNAIDSCRYFVTCASSLTNVTVYTQLRAIGRWS